MIVVPDSSPLVCLRVIGRLELLRDLKRNGHATQGRVLPTKAKHDDLEGDKQRKRMKDEG